MEFIKKQESNPVRLLWARILMIASILCALSSLALLAYAVVLSHPFSMTKSTNAHNAKNSSLNSITERDAQAVNAVAKQYMDALLQQHYDTMWSLLSPQIQAQWTSQSTFAAFWKKRFQDYNLQSFTVGKVSDESFWVNPETMTRYDKVKALPVSLQLEPKTPAPPNSTIAPQFAHPSQLFQNLPFVVQSVPSQNGKTNQWVVLAGGPADPEAPLLPPTQALPNRVNVPILMYHYISDVPKNDPDPRLRKDLSVSPKDFSDQLDYLKAQKFQSITFNQLFNAIYYQAPLPAKPIIFTFDDGYEDAYTTAYPSLQAHGFSGMFYLVTGEVGWVNHIKSWDNVREMVAHGMQMGSHTPHHKDIREALNVSPAATAQILTDSQNTLQTELKMPIQQFCYPAGQPFVSGTKVQREEIASLLAQTGYIGATTTQWGSTQSSIAPFEMPRLRIRGTDTLADFKSLFSA